MQMNRYFSLAPDPDHARSCIAKLLDANFNEHHISLIADASVALDEISMEEESKTWEALDVLQRSIANGGSPGMFTGLRAVSLPSINMMLAGRAILSADRVNLGFQVVLSHSLHLHVSHSILQRLQSQILQGKVLLILGMEPVLVPSFNRFVQGKCPEIGFNYDAGMMSASDNDRFMESILYQAC